MKDSQVVVSESEVRALEELKLFYKYGKYHLENGSPEDAAILLTGGVRRMNLDRLCISRSPLKEITVELHLLLAEALLFTNRLEDVQEILNKVSHPTNVLAIGSTHKHYLWLSRLHHHAQIGIPVTSRLRGSPVVQGSSLSFYEVS